MTMLWNRLRGIFWFLNNDVAISKTFAGSVETYFWNSNIWEGDRICEYQCKPFTLLIWTTKLTSFNELNASGYVILIIDSECPLDNNTFPVTVIGKVVDIQSLTIT